MSRKLSLPATTGQQGNGLPIPAPGEGGVRGLPKDSFVLQVDASDRPATIGPDTITRNGLAYQLSTTIFACWIEHP